MRSKDDVVNIFAPVFSPRFSSAAVDHYLVAVDKYRSGDWEGAVLRVGKFVEAVTKMIAHHAGVTLPVARRFSVSGVFRTIETVTTLDDSLRILTPRACVFVYDIASNRGARHDPHLVDPNEMDASVCLPVASWILAELVRYASSGSSTPADTMTLIEEITIKKYPNIENIAGRTYVNSRNVGARELGLLVLNAHYPRRVARSELSATLRRHGKSGSATKQGLASLKRVVDENDEGWVLRGNGREEAEQLRTQLDA